MTTRVAQGRDPALVERPPSSPLTWNRGWLRFTDIDGHCFTCFVTGTRRGQLADLELRHRRRVRCEDRIRAAKDRQSELTAWAPMLALRDHSARHWEPNACLRIFSAAARLANGGGRLRLRLTSRWPWTDLITTAITRLQMLPAP